MAFLSLAPALCVPHKQQQKIYFIIFLFILLEPILARNNKDKRFYVHKFLAVHKSSRKYYQFFLHKNEFMTTAEPSKKQRLLNYF